MSDLPPELRPWEAELSVLPRELALGLGPLVLHVARELGPLGARSVPAGGEPDGYDGLSRRGNYERLASVEWLYALELPDEFFRRAVYGEQSFLHLRLREPGGVRRSVALFDAGPGQLGGPRIAQLAVLVALARRAAEQGAEFEWGVLQGRELQRGFTQSNVLHLLSGRSTREPVAADLERWRATVEGASEPDDLWLAGSERLAELEGAEGTSILAVRDVVEPEARKIAVEVRRPGSSVHRAWTATISLDLPAPDACVRLLRDPFRVARATPLTIPGAVDAASGIHFSPNGGWLVVRLQSRELLVVAIPDSPRDESGARPRLIGEAAGIDIVAIGLRGSRLAFAHLEPGSLRVHFFGKYGSKLAAVETSAVPALPLVVRRHPGVLYWEEGSSVLIDAVGHRFTKVAGGSWLAAGSGIASSVVRRGRVVTIRPAEDSSAAYTTALVDDGEMRIPLREHFERIVAFFGFPQRGADPAELVAVMLSPGVWGVHTYRKCYELHAPTGSRVVGVAVGDAGEPGLLLLEDGALSLVGGHFAQALRLPARVATAAASPYRPVVAAVGEKGQLYVWSLQHRALVVHLEPVWR